MNKLICFPVALALLSASPSAHAVVTDGASSSPAAPALEVFAGSPARTHREVRWNRVPAAVERLWQGFVGASGGTWNNLWDWDTGVPSRIYGSGIPAPGSIAKPEVAAYYALDTLARHIDLLAPGASVDDFQLVSNHLHDGMRTIGLHQYHRGMRVLGGQVSFRFKADRLFVIGSEALPRVDASVPRIALDPAVVSERARSWIAAEATVVRVGESAGPFVLPVVTRAGPKYHTVVRVTVEARAPIGRWDVYVDAHVGDLVAREQRLRFGQARIEYDAPVRYPADGRQYYPARDTNVEVTGGPAGTDADGNITWTGTAPTDVTTVVSGTYFRVLSEQRGAAVE
jgi:hypothetical protein